jgi:hypothetical protein
MRYVEKYYTASQTTNGITGHDTPIDIHSEYVRIIAFTEQQWLFEYALILHLYVYCVSCLIIYIYIYI